MGFGIFAALSDGLRNMIEGKLPMELRQDRIQKIQQRQVFHVPIIHPIWPGPDDLPHAGPPTASVQDSGGGRAHTGIARSEPVADSVMELHVGAKEFRRFSESLGSQAAVVKYLCSKFPYLEVLVLDDDYLTDAEQSAWQAALAPLQVVWTQGMVIDGRHGR